MPSIQPTDTLSLMQLSGATPWSNLEQWPQREREFSFVLLSDRTGLPKPGVFEHAIQATNWLRPDFAIQIGDCIEGYTRKADVLAGEWSEFEDIASKLEVPLFRVPGNHDVSNEFMRTEWLRRYGALHYHFRYRDVLFLVLDTQDPPQRLSDFGGLDQVPGAAGEDRELDMDALRRSYEADPFAFAQHVERSMDGEGRQPAHIGEAQTQWAIDTLNAHADVRWTVLLMHMPAWQGSAHPSLVRLREALAGRPYTAFAGHLHNYQRRVIEGNEHIRLGPSGGAWVTTREEGNFDHITWVTVTAAGLQIANLVLDGVLGREGGAFRPRPVFSKPGADHATRAEPASPTLA